MSAFSRVARQLYSTGSKTLHAAPKSNTNALQQRSFASGGVCRLGLSGALDLPSCDTLQCPPAPTPYAQ